MTPTCAPFHSAVTLLANGRSTSSATGSASMSARKATTGPGSAPFSSPTTPVWATPVRTSSKPSARRWSATMPAVRNSRLPSSGWACRSRRQAISRASMSRAAASIWLLSELAGMAGVTGVGLLGVLDMRSPGAGAGRERRAGWASGQGRRGGVQGLKSPAQNTAQLAGST